MLAYVRVRARLRNFVFCGSSKYRSAQCHPSLPASELCVPLRCPPLSAPASALRALLYRAVTWRVAPLVLLQCRLSASDVIVLPLLKSKTQFAFAAYLPGPGRRYDHIAEALWRKRRARTACTHHSAVALPERHHSPPNGRGGEDVPAVLGR